MTDYTKLIEALRCKVGITEEETKCEKCPYGTGFSDCDVERYCNDAAAAIEALNRLLDQNTQRCEALRKQLREAHESYEKHLNELEAQLPKRGEWINHKDEHQCSVCRETVVVDEIRWEQIGAYDYCPNCGAKMEVQDEGTGSL